VIRTELFDLTDCKVGSSLNGLVTDFLDNACIKNYQMQKPEHHKKAYENKTNTVGFHGFA